MEKTLANYIAYLRRDFTSFCNEKLQNMGLSQGLLFFIIYVGKHPGCSPKELAQALSLDTGHVTRSIAKLEQSGFLSQECDQNDRRGRILNLETRGEEAFRKSYELFDLWDKEVLKDTSESDRMLLLEVLGKLVDSREEKKGV